MKSQVWQKVPALRTNSFVERDDHVMRPWVMPLRSSGLKNDAKASTWTAPQIRGIAMSTRIMWVSLAFMVALGDVYCARTR